MTEVRRRSSAGSEKREHDQPRQLQEEGDEVERGALDPDEAEAEGSLRNPLLCAGAIVLLAHAFILALYQGWVPVPSSGRSAAQSRRNALDMETVYLMEASMSLDNLFAFYLVFKYFRVTATAQRRVLLWGIAGAALLRAAAIAVGTALVQRFQWVLLLFATVLLFQGVQFCFFDAGDEEEEDLSQNAVVQAVCRLLPCTRSFHGTRFFVREGGRLRATPLLVVLVVIELSDVIFAMDSVPAAFGVTQKGWVIFCANMFDIAALRSLYPIVAVLVADLPLLQRAVGLVLIFVGGKVFSAFLGFPISDVASLVVIASILTLGTLASVQQKRNQKLGGVTATSSATAAATLDWRAAGGEGTAAGSDLDVVVVVEETRSLLQE